MKSTIKTIVIVVLSMLVVFTTTFTILTFSLIGCGNMTELRELIARDVMFEELSNITIENEVEVVVPEIEVTLPQIDGTQPEVTTPETDNTTDIIVPQPEEDEVEPLVIWNMNGIKVTVLGLDMDGFYGPEMYVEIENNMANDLLIGLDNVSVNGYMMDPFWSTTITAGNKARETIYWFEESCIERGIEDISVVEFVINACDADTWTSILETPTIRVTFE